MDSFGMSCVKYLLFLFNLLFALTGLLILTVGVLINQKYGPYQEFIDEKYFTGPMVMIIVGVIIFVVAFFGCCGAIRESNCMLITFAFLLVAIFLSEVALGVAFYLMQDSIQSTVEDHMNLTMNQYAENKEYEKTWDILQFDLDCCGVKSPEDWKNVFHNSTLPHSCCKKIPVDAECTLKDSSKVGCLPQLKDFLLENTSFAGAFGVGVACFQLIGVIFACCLARSIRQEYEIV